MWWVKNAYTYATSNVPVLIHTVSFLANIHDANLYITEQPSVLLTPATSCATTGDIH